MQISIGNIAAKCPRCGGTEFNALVTTANQEPETAACARCGAQTAHADLLIQIGDEAIRQAKQTLAEIKKQREDGPPKGR